MKLVLLDIDGTILTSRGTARRAIQDAVAEISGTEIDVSAVSFAGRTDPAIMRDLLQSSGLTESEIDEVLPTCLASYVSVLMQTLTPILVSLLPGMESLIRELDRREDVLLGLLTGNLRETAFLKLHAAGVGSFFPLGAFGSDHEDRNELPGIASARATSHCGFAIRRDRTVIVGDTPSDIDCAVHYGAKSVAVCTGIFSRAELEFHAADLLIDDLEDPSPLLNLIEAL